MIGIVVSCFSTFFLGCHAASTCLLTDHFFHVTADWMITNHDFAGTHQVRTHKSAQPFAKRHKLWYPWPARPARLIFFPWSGAVFLSFSGGYPWKGKLHTFKPRDSCLMVWSHLGFGSGQVRSGEVFLIGRVRVRVKEGDLQRPWTQDCLRIAEDPPLVSLFRLMLLCK